MLFFILFIYIFCIFYCCCYCFRWIFSICTYVDFLTSAAILYIFFIICGYAIADVSVGVVVLIFFIIFFALLLLYIITYRAYNKLLRHVNAPTLGVIKSCFFHHKFSLWLLFAIYSMCDVLHVCVHLYAYRVSMSFACVNFFRSFFF